LVVKRAERLWRTDAPWKPSGVPKIDARRILRSAFCPASKPFGLRLIGLRLICASTGQNSIKAWVFISQSPSKPFFPQQNNILLEPFEKADRILWG